MVSIQDKLGKGHEGRENQPQSGEQLIKQRSHKKYKIEEERPKKLDKVDEERCKLQKEMDKKLGEVMNKGHNAQTKDAKGANRLECMGIKSV